MAIEPSIADLERVDPAERREQHLSRLRTHAAHAGHTEFYRDRFADAGIVPGELEDISQLPMITKSEIIADQATSPPYGTMLGVAPREVIRQYIGPGPQTAYFTATDYDRIVSDATWAFRAMGFRPEDTVDNTIMYHWVIAGTSIDAAFRNIGCAVIPGGVGNAEMHLDVMRWSRVTGLFAFPTFLDELESKARDLGIDPAQELNLRLATISGELRSADAKTRMEAFWGMSVRELYGGSEVPFTGAEADCGGGMHINPRVIFEVIDPETGDQVQKGSPGVVVVTDLARRAYPMIRYFTGDITESYDPAECECGRTTGKFGRIVGRYGDITRVKGLFLVPSAVRESLDKAGATGNYQLVIDRPGTRDHLTIRVEGDFDAVAAAAAVKAGTRLSAEIDQVPVGTLDGLASIDDRRDV